MHELLNFACEELEELESKAKRGKLSMSDIQYADTLAHFKKNLLASEGMMEGMSSRNSSRRSYENSNRSYESYEGNSNARRGRDGDGDGRYSEGSYRNSRDSYGSYEYSRDGAKDSMVKQLKKMAEESMNENDRIAIMNCIDRIK